MDELGEFRQRLESRISLFTKSESAIASYLLANHDEAAFLSAAQMARRLQVSEATVVRFAQSVGYVGFPALRRELQGIFRARTTPAARLKHKLEELGAGQGHVFAKVVEMEVEYLAEALHSIDPGEFDRAVALLLAGRRIFVSAVGPSRMLADLAELRLRRFGITAFAINESGRDLLEKLQMLEPTDVLLATGFIRITPELAAVMGRAGALGTPVVLITDTLAPYFKSKADVILAARRGPVSTFHSLTVPLAILNALLLAVAMERPQESVAALNRLQLLRETYDPDAPMPKASP
jgi:DNA-binding MurR/RpiR family transcriptional regulator